MSTQYIAVPNGHTIVHLQILEYYTFTTRVYIRLIAAGHADFVGKAIMSFRTEWEHMLISPRVGLLRPTTASDRPALMPTAS